MPSQSLRLSLRFLLPLTLVLVLFAYAAVPLTEKLTVRWFVRDLDIRSQLLASALEEPLLVYLPQRARKQINQRFDRAIRDERLYALGLCDAAGSLLYKTATFPHRFPAASRPRTRPTLEAVRCCVCRKAPSMFPSAT